MMVPNVYLCLINGIFYLSVEDYVAAALVTMVEDKINKTTIRDYSSAKRHVHFKTSYVGQILKTS